MDASSAVVVKVKYGDMLRRFNAPIVNEKLLLNVDGLREKILSLFSFAPDTDLMLTYIDEDGDVVALVDDDDLLDVVKQGLNPLRVTVKLNDDQNGNQNHSNASSTPLRSPRVQPLPNLSAGVSELMRKVPEPLRETLLKLSDDLACKASSTTPNISELVDNLSKVSLSFLGQLSESGVKLNMQSSSDTDNLASEAPKADPAANAKRNEVNIQTVTGQRKDCPSFDFNAVAAALESQDVPVSKPEPGSFPHNALRKEKAKKAIECSSGESHVGKVAEFSSNKHPSLVDNKFTGSAIYISSEPKLVSNPTSDGSSYLVNADHVSEKVKFPMRGAFKSASVPTGTPYKNAFLGSFHPPNPPRPMYECPFSGTSFDNISAAPPHLASDAVPFKRSNSQNNNNANAFHRGVRCDGCGIHPIVGPRFKSKVKVDYDLCRVCFEKMGNDNDYIRMDRPVHRHHLPHFRPREHGAMFAHGRRCSRDKLGAIKLDSRFIQDVNVFDDTIMAPLTPFTKLWRMKNNGTAPWPQKTQLVWIGGDKLTDTQSVEVQIPAAGLMMDQELDVAIDFISPELPGRYISFWRLASPSGQKFGQRIWVLIQVDASIDETPQDLNLNLPPVSSSLTGPEIINIDVEPVREIPHPKAGKMKKIVESEVPNTENELKFPINDSLFVGNGAASSSAPPASSSSIQYPIIDLSDMIPTLSSVTPATTLFPMPPPPPPPPAAPKPELPANHVEEDRLLKELEEMGFKQVDLNKEVLRMNEYDLLQSVDDLCGVAEWDPMLEELAEMGFDDTEMNKVLLKKNNGSIKRVVMDLIAGEKV